MSDVTSPPSAPRWLDYLPLDELVPDERNPKAHDLDELRASMGRFGYTEPIMLDERTGKLVAGHGRREILLDDHAKGAAPPEGVMVDEATGRWYVPVNRGWSSVDDDEAGAYLIASNSLTMAGGWKPDPLGSLLDHLRQRPRGLVGIGFTSDAVTSILDRLAKQRAAEAAAPKGSSSSTPPTPEPPREPVTRPGDVWQIGPHRLVCGSAHELDVFAAVLDGRRVNVAFTSPPYADRREYDPSSGFRPIHPDAYVEWFAPVAANVATVLADDGSWFVNIKAGADDLDRELYVYDLVIAHVRQWGWHLGDELCWERPGVPGRVALRFKNQWESVFHFGRARWKIRPENVAHRSEQAIIPPGMIEGDMRNWQGTGEPSGEPATRRVPRDGDRKAGFGEHQGEPGVDAFAGHRQLGLAFPGNRLPSFVGSHEALGHAAAFPVGLPEWFVRAYSDEGDVILDPFCGTGSTLLAAHARGRVGCGIELSPAYCDVILARIQRHTGLVPTRDGEAFDFSEVETPAPPVEQPEAGEPVVV